MSAPTLYSCFDFRFASEIALGELTPAAEGDDRPVVTIRCGPVADPAEGDDSGWGLHREGDSVTLRVARVGRYRMTGGREIIVDPLPGASACNVRLFLLGSALGVLAYQRGLLPLHANAVVIDGRAHAFCGPSGAGKSTLAAHFSAAGHAVLCDDVCAVSFDAEGKPRAWPGLPRLKLWRDAADRMGHDIATLDRAIEGMDKYHVTLPRAVVAAPVPLARLYLLGRVEAADGARIERLRGAAAMEVVMANSYRPGYVRQLGLAGDHFAACGALARHAAIFHARRDWGFDVFAREAARLVEHARSAAA
ncbi:hypothetical protein [Sphingomonas sp.]|uniref:hypothetical protein n=1 Tax=Sphingomonas sp. TaxID=28214 RepID=UPI002DD6B50C|nr:hypothetical protein [Sphingomonas sp.]